jgi:prevent-host-death family protein
MLKQISLREANQHLSRYVEMVEEGNEVIITRRGQPIVQLTRVAKKRQLTPVQQRVFKRLMARMCKGYNVGGKKFDREAAHER